MKNKGKKILITTVLSLLMVNNVFASSVVTAKNIIVNSDSKLVLNEVPDLNFVEYDGEKYYRLRDVARILNSYSYDVDVTWSNEDKATVIIPWIPYEVVKSDTMVTSNSDLNTKKIKTKVAVGDEAFELDTINVNGSNYYKSDDLGNIFDIGFLYNKEKDLEVLYLNKTYDNIQKEEELYKKQYGKVVQQKFDGSNQLAPINEDDLVATIETTMGDITIKLLPEYAPVAVENFVKLSESNYYDGLVFHRVIQDFMIQGGDPKGNGTGGNSYWEEPFSVEPNVNARHYTGALSMANAGFDSNGSQFFIVANLIDTEYKDRLDKRIEEVNKTIENDEYEYDLYMNKVYNKSLFPSEVLENYKKIGGQPHLDFDYTVFGQVMKGQDIVDKISMVATSEGDKPLEDIVIKDIKINYGNKVK